MKPIFDYRVAIADLFDAMLTALAGAGVFGAPAIPIVVAAVVIQGQKEVRKYIAALSSADELPVGAAAAFPEGGALEVRGPAP